MLSNHLILCHPLLLLPSIFPSIWVFSNESALHIRWPKYWSFSFNISPTNEHSGLISFRMNWLNLLAVQGTLKSLLQHHSSKASILWRSAFFIAQLSHPYMTTGKTIKLNISTSAYNTDCSPLKFYFPSITMCSVASVVSHSLWLWTVAHQAPLSMGFSRQEYWRGCHVLLQVIFPTQGSNPCLLPGRWIFIFPPLNHWGRPSHHHTIDTLYPFCTQFSYSLALLSLSLW